MKLHNRGFGLIELLISILIGIIVVTGITSLVVATLRANTENLGMTRLTQELRGAAQLISGELKRSAYDQDALGDFGAGNQDSNGFVDVVFEDSGGTVLDPVNNAVTEANPATCVVYGYDENMNGTVDAGEYRAFRLNDGAIEMWEGDVAVASCPGDGWEALTDRAATEITDFSITTTPDGEAFPVHSDPGTGVQTLAIRKIQIRIAGQSVQDDSVSRSVRETVRIRNDRVL